MICGIAQLPEERYFALDLCYILIVGMLEVDNLVNIAYYISALTHSETVISHLERDNLARSLVLALVDAPVRSFANNLELLVAAVALPDIVASGCPF